MNYFVTFYETITHPFNRDHKLKTIARIIYWKINQLFFHIPAIINIEKNIKCICYPDSSYGSMVVYNRWPEYGVIKNIISNLSGRDVYVDVGANFGDTTLVAAAHTKGEIYAFEPSPVAYPRLKENIRLNNLSNQIIAEQIILSDHIGYANFVDTSTSETSHLSSKKDTSDYIKIKSCTLDDYAREKNIKTIKLLKIDVEGSELIVLRGAKKLLAEHRIRNILVELNTDAANYGYNNSDTVNYLKSFGYKIPVLPIDMDKRIINIHAKISR